MPRFASGKVVTGSIVFAAIVIVLSIVGPGIGVFLFYALYLLVILTALYFVVRWAVAAGIRDAGVRGRARTAREVLDERYARGEIGAEEYGRMRGRLETP